MDQAQLSYMEIEPKDNQDISMAGVDDIQDMSLVKSKKKNSVVEIDNSQERSLDDQKESTFRMFLRRSFDTFTDISSKTYNVIMNILKNQPGIIYMAVFMLLVGLSRASPIQDQKNFLAPNAFTRIQADQEMILFDVSSFDTKDFIFDLGEVNHGTQTGLNSSCDAIISMNKQCSLHPENCQAAELAIMNLESSIEKYIQTKYALNRVCDAGRIPSSREVIQRCQAGENWESQSRGKRYIPSRAIPSSTATPEEDFTSSEEHLDPDSIVERFRRFVISTAILIATAFGVAGLATAAGTAAVISKHQAQKVLKKVQGNRAEDIKNSIVNDKFVLGLIQDTGSDLDGVR